MKNFLATFTIPLCIAIGFVISTTAVADNKSGHRGKQLVVQRDVDTFAVLPQGVRLPEGITANPANGDIYVGTFDSPSTLLRYDSRGRLVASQELGPAPLLGLEFDVVNHKVYITSVGDFTGIAGVDSKVQRVNADLSGLEDVAVIPGIGAPAPRIVGNPDGSADTITFGFGARVPNSMTFDTDGNLYVSDSFQGAIFKISHPDSCSPCTVETFSQDPRLATPGFPPFGANGLAFNGDESALFIANTGDDRILSLDVVSKEVTVFAESINGADGIATDKHGLLWVAANQADEIVALNANGKVVAVLGEFKGIRNNGTPKGLLFPASLVIVRKNIFVTNLAVALTGVAGDEPEEDVTSWTLSRIKLPNHR